MYIKHKMSYIGLLNETSMTTYTNVSATDDLTAGTSLRNLGTSTQIIGTATFSGGITRITTSLVSEGINLYWTLVRFNTAFATKTTTDLLEGTNLYYSLAILNADLATKATDDLNQGITNKYLNALSTSDTTEINHTYSTLSPILSSTINAGSIILSKLNFFLILLILQLLL